MAEAGLGAHPALALLRASVPADASFVVRTHLLREDTCRYMDALTLEAVERLAGLGVWPGGKREWAMLPVSAGGLGLTSMEIVAPSAFAAAWGQGFVRTMNQNGVQAVPHQVVGLEVLSAPLDEAARRCAILGVDIKVDIAAAAGKKAKELQGEWTKAANARRREIVLAALSLEDKAILRAAGGKGAGAWLEAHDGRDVERLWLTDAEFGMAMGIRLAIVPNQTGGCRHRTAGGAQCGQNLRGDDRWHPLLCSHGPGHNARHNSVVRTLARCIQKEMESPVLLEQEVPGWSRDLPDGGVERARLDIVTQGWDGRLRYIDVTVGCVVGRGAQCRAAPNYDGAVAARMENIKRARYQGPNLIPAALEHPGRMGEAFTGLVRWICHKQHIAERGMAMRAVYREVSMALQQANARIMLEAGHVVRVVRKEGVY